MTNVAMVRMSVQDKKLSNPSKPSEKKTADFFCMIGTKAADVRDAKVPQPDGKVKKKDETNIEDSQILELCYGFTAGLEGDGSQPVPVWEGLLLEDEKGVSVLENMRDRQGGIPESNTARLFAESRTVQEETAETEDMSVTAQAVKTSVAEEHAGFPMDEAERQKETGAGKELSVPQQEKDGDLQEISRLQADEHSQIAEKKNVTGSRKEEPGRTADQEQAAEASKQALFISAEAGNKGAKNAVYQTAGHTETVRTTRQALSADVGKIIASRMPQKNGEMTIELEPASLGKIIVRVTYDAGRASVALMTANPRTLEILSRDAGSIAGMIEEKTGQETMVFIPQQEAYQEESQREHRSDDKEQKQKNDRKKQQAESFIQQVRLGLV